MFHSINWPGLALFLGKVIGYIAMVTAPFVMLYLWLVGIL